jgi:hypothetical protein
MARLNQQDMMSVLQSRGYSRDSKTMIAAAMADGRPGRALELLSDDGYWVLRDKAMGALEQLTCGKQLAAAMKFMQDNRAKAGEVLTIWECAVRDAAIAASGSKAPLLTGAVPGFLKSVSREAMEKMLSDFAGARRALDGNAVYSMAMDNLLIELAGGI